jgi:uncharacterized membrane protein YphA (DoxX/SURF4 family)
MNARLVKSSIPLLRWAVGLVLLLESFRFVFSTAAPHFLAKAGLPSWIRPVLGGAEIIAALLFLVPFTALIGGYLLLVILALAALLHILHGQYDIEGLIVYAAAVLVCLAHTPARSTELSHERL